MVTIPEVEKGLVIYTVLSRVLAIPGVVSGVCRSAGQNELPARRALEACDRGPI